VGKQVGDTHCECNGEVDDNEDNEEEESVEDKNDILIGDENEFKGHSQGGCFTERRRFLGRGRRRRMRKLLRYFDCLYILLESKKRGRDYFQVPRYFRKRDIPSTRSGTIFGQGNPCEKQCDRLCTLLRYL
jgi:hypothetical protein